MVLTVGVIVGFGDWITWIWRLDNKDRPVVNDGRGVGGDKLSASESDETCASDLLDWNRRETIDGDRRRSRVARRNDIWNA